MTNRKIAVAIRNLIDATDDSPTGAAIRGGARDVALVLAAKMFTCTNPRSQHARDAWMRMALGTRIKESE